MSDVKDRVVRALEAEFGDTVYLNHVTIQKDIIAVEFKTRMGLFGIARYKFTDKTLEKL